jgi:prepilin-type N-terminal cleavage/methylation domain-containing protein
MVYTAIVMIRGAYTLIELVIAVAIIALLSAMTIPRFETYNAQNALRASAQQLAACLQAAEQSVQAPSAAVSQTTVTVMNSANSVACTNAPADSNGHPISSLMYSPVIANLNVCSAGSLATTAQTSMEMSNSLSYTLYLSNRGRLSQASIATIKIGPPLTLTVADTSADCSTSNAPVAYVYVPVTGSPVQLTTSGGDSF